MKTPYQSLLLLVLLAGCQAQPLATSTTQPPAAVVTAVAAAPAPALSAHVPPALAQATRNLQAAGQQAGFWGVNLWYGGHNGYPDYIAVYAEPANGPYAYDGVNDAVFGGTPIAGFVKEDPSFDTTASGYYGVTYTVPDNMHLVINSIQQPALASATNGNGGDMALINDIFVAAEGTLFNEASGNGNYTPILQTPTYHFEFDSGAKVTLAGQCVAIATAWAFSGYLENNADLQAPPK